MDILILILITIVLTVMIYVLLIIKVRRIKSLLVKILSVLLMLISFFPVVVNTFLFTSYISDKLVFLHDDFDSISIENISYEEKLDKLIKQFNGEAYYWNYHGEIIKPSDKRRYRHFEINCKIDAAKLLGEMGPKAKKAVPVLLDALKNRSNDIDTGDGILPYRSTIAIALGKIGDPIAISPLIEKLKIKDTAAISPSATFSPDWEHPVGIGNKAIVEALGMFGRRAKDAVPLILPLLSDSEDRHDFTPVYAIRALAGIQDPRAVPALVEYLKTGQCKGAAIEALDSFAPDEKIVMPVLIDTLRDDRYEGEAAAALARYGPKATVALPTLRAILEELERDDTYSQRMDARLVRNAIKSIEAGIN